MAVGRRFVFGQLVAYHDVDLGRGDAAAVDGMDAEGGSEAEGGGGLVEDGGIDPGVDESAQEHVSADAGKAVEIGDSHRVIVADDELSRRVA